MSHKTGSGAARRASELKRMRIAACAARIMAEGESRDCAAAKHKAAQQLGYLHPNDLPSDQEVDEALVEYRALFAPEHATLLLNLRNKALFLMRFFAGYNPYLTGSVLAGSAGPHSDINLVIYHDDSKAIERFLIDQQIDYRYHETSGEAHLANFPTLAFWFDDTPVKLYIRPQVDERKPSRKELRATLRELEAILTPK